MATSPLLILDANGAPRIAPSVSSRWTFDQTSTARYIAQHDVIELSYMEGGPANQLVPYLDAQEIASIYDPESLQILGADLANYLYAPSGDYNVRGAYRTYVLRLGQPTGASLILNNDAAQPVLTLTSDDAGTYANKNSVQVASGTVVGKRLTFRFRQEMIVLDNLLNAMHLAYTGNASAATLTITRTGDKAVRLQTTLTGASDGSIPMDLDLYGNALLPSAELDGVAGATIRTPPALLIHYVGAGSAATMTVTNTALTTTVTGGPGGQNLNIDFTAATTDTLA